ncbi:MAG TPA: 3'(2'),5'-bisphosphate nucleotidase CysQ [Kofleriaceae bacterium]|nr:3'(2'),5'-bisphosphate nucleotidase CysQ [Kofleriaceae bacterium]
MSFARELARAIELARLAGAEVMRMQRGELGVEMKPGDEPVTVADRRASEMIVAGLAESFPGDPIISEELTPAAGALGAPRVWLVDPIDGTKEFIRGEDGYSVMIGLVCDGRPTVGVVYQPVIDRLFYGTPEGARMTYQGQTTPLAVSAITSASEVRLVASKSQRNAVLDRVKEQLGIDNELNLGSVGVKLCVIAAGVRDLYINPAAKTKAWDTCAPEAILVPAGGRLSDLLGNPIDYTRELAHRRGLVASNGRVHDEVVAKLAPLFPHLAARRAPDLA